MGAALPNLASKDSEDRVKRALEILKGRNSFFTDYYKSQYDCELDSHQIDFIIYLANFMAFPLQVKGNTKSVIDHYKKRPYVHVLVVRKSHSPEKIAHKIESLVMRILRNPFKTRVKTKTPVCA